MDKYAQLIIILQKLQAVPTTTLIGVVIATIINTPVNEVFEKKLLHNVYDMIQDDGVVMEKILSKETVKLIKAYVEK